MRPSYSLVTRLSVILLAGFLTATAQQAPRDAQALQLLSQSFLAMGGDRIASMHDVKVEGALVSPSFPEVVHGTFVAKARGRDFIFESTANGNQRSYRLLNGEGSFRFNNGVTPLMPYNTNGLGFDILPILSRWTEFLREATAILPPESVEVDGIPGYLIRVESQEETERFKRNDHGKTDVVLDASTGLVLAIRYHATQSPYASDRIAIENRFSDYQSFGGFLFPTRITRYIGARPVLVLRIESVQFNNGFTDLDFRN